MDKKVWNAVTTLLRHPEVVLSEIGEATKDRHQAIDKALKEMKAIDRRERSCQEAQDKAFRGFTRNLVDEDVYIRELASLKAERAWIQEERDRVKGRLAALDRTEVTTAQLKKLAQSVSEKLDDMDTEARRWVLSCLDARVIDGPEGISLELAIPERTASVVSTRPCRCCSSRSRCPLCAWVRVQDFQPCGLVQDYGLPLKCPDPTRLVPVQGPVPYQVKGIVGIAPALQHRIHPIAVQHIHQPAEVVLVGMGQHHNVEVPVPEFEPVSHGTNCVPGPGSSIHKHLPALCRGYEHAVALAHVQEVDVESAIGTGGDLKPEHGGECGQASSRHKICCNGER